MDVARLHSIGCEVIFGHFVELLMSPFRLMNIYLLVLAFASIWSLVLVYDSKLAKNTPFSVSSELLMSPFRLSNSIIFYFLR